MKEFPIVPLRQLDNLWFLIAGTRCNTTCSHCFLNCSPQNAAYGMMTLEQVKAYVQQSIPLGVREYYFTGGEPLLHNDLEPILRHTIQHGPITLLTNAMLISKRKADSFAHIFSESPYSFEIRVSLDGYNAPMNDSIRGKGSFEKALMGVQQLCRVGFLPIITITQTWDDSKSLKVMNEFKRLLTQVGYLRPRIKILPMLKIGKETERTQGYYDDQWLTKDMMAGYDTEQLLCSNSRMVTDRGVVVCPILAGEKGCFVDDQLKLTNQTFVLSHQACYTCYQFGAICSNLGTGDHYG